MLTHDAMLRIARRYDTVMSQAMMRALGYGAQPHGGRRRRAKPAATTTKQVEEHRYQGMAWCFRNHGSPMDMR